MRSLLVLLSLAVVQPALAGEPLDAKAVEAAKKAVDQGITFLKGKQAEDGSYGGHVGLTAMVLMAYAESHQALRNDAGPFISKAADWLAAQAKPDGSITGDATPTYNTALSIMALHALDPVKYKALVQAGQKYLADDQDDEDRKYEKSHKYYGGMGYDGDERPDLSNLHYALEALRKTDYDANSDVWAKAEIFINRSQNRSESNDQPWAGNDGGFIYGPGESKAGGTTSYGSMSFAGLKSLIFVKAKHDDPRVKAVWDWISKHYDFNSNPGMGTTSYYYYLQTAGGALEAFGEDFVPDEKGRKRRWAADLISKVASLQQADGSWANPDPKYWEGNPVLATARSISTLNHALRSAGANSK